MLHVGGDLDLVQEPVSPNCHHQFRTEHLDRDLPISEGGFDAVESARHGRNYAAAESLPRVGLVRYQGPVGVS